MATRKSSVQVQWWVACLDNALLVSLSSGVTLSFLTRSSACVFTASWSRTMFSANALTSLLLALVNACLPAVTSITPAVYAICAICGSVSLAPSASAGLLKSVIAAIAALHRMNMIDLLWVSSCERTRLGLPGFIDFSCTKLEHVPPGLNRGFPWRGSISESIGIDSLGGAGRCRRPIQQT